MSDNTLNNKKSRYWGLTIPFKMENVGNNVLKFIENKMIENDVFNYTYACSNLEIGDETEYEHYHVLIRFKGACRFSTLKKIFGNIHIENVVHPVSYLNYIAKTGLLYNDINLQEKEELSKCIIEDIKCGFTLKQLIYKYPTFSLYHFSQLKSLYDFLNFDDYEEKNVK